MKVKTLEKYNNGTQITIKNKLTGELIRSILVSEELYNHNKKLFNKVRNPITNNIEDLTYIVNTVNGKYAKYKESEILFDCIFTRNVYEIVQITDYKPVKLHKGDSIVFQEYNSSRKIEKKFVKVVTNHWNELGINDNGLALLLRSEPYLNKFFKWDKTLYFIQEIKQTRLSKFLNLFNL